MLIKSVITGIQTGLYENAYIVRAVGAEEAVVIDPGDGLQQIVAELEKSGLSISHILLTHGHADHLA
ncbi:MAG: MBL fold metallo-hydrolase, partial [Christensenella sp.]